MEEEKKMKLPQAEERTRVSLQENPTAKSIFDIIKLINKNKNKLKFVSQESIDTIAYITTAFLDYLWKKSALSRAGFEERYAKNAVCLDVIRRVRKAKIGIRLIMLDYILEPKKISSANFPSYYELLQMYLPRIASEANKKLTEMKKEGKEDEETVKHLQSIIDLYKSAKEELN